MKSSPLSVLNRAYLTRSLVLGLVASSHLIAAEAPVSWWRDVTPIFKRSCNGCHNPNKLKGEVDTSTFAGLMKPGKHGSNLAAGGSGQIAAHHLHLRQGTGHAQGG